MENRHVWRLVRSHMPGRWVRVESHITKGFPDCVGVNSGVTQLMELKHLRHEPEAVGRLGMTAQQHAFLINWPCWLLVRVRNERLAFIHGSRAPQRRAPPDNWWRVAHLIEPIRGCDWDKVGSVIFGV